MLIYKSSLKLRLLLSDIATYLRELLTGVTYVYLKLQFIYLIAATLQDDRAVLSNSKIFICIIRVYVERNHNFVKASLHATFSFK